MLDVDPSLIATLNRKGESAIEKTIGENEIEIPFGSKEGTALHYAVKNGSLNMVSLLLERGAQVNAVTEPAKWTPLHDAVYYGIYNDQRNAKEIIRKLVDAGADLHAETWGGIEPLDIASYLSFCDGAAAIFDLVQSLERGR